MYYDNEKLYNPPVNGGGTLTGDGGAVIGGWDVGNPELNHFPGLAMFPPSVSNLERKKKENFNWKNIQCSRF